MLNNKTSYDFVTNGKEMRYLEDVKIKFNLIYELKYRKQSCSYSYIQFMWLCSQEGKWSNKWWIRLLEALLDEGSHTWLLEMCIHFLTVWDRLCCFLHVIHCLLHQCCKANTTRGFHALRWHCPFLYILLKSEQVSGLGRWIEPNNPIIITPSAKY